LSDSPSCDALEINHLKEAAKSLGINDLDLLAKQMDVLVRLKKKLKSEKSHKEHLKSISSKILDLRQHMVNSLANLGSADSYRGRNMMYVIIFYFIYFYYLYLFIFNKSCFVFWC